MFRFVIALAIGLSGFGLAHAQTSSMGFGQQRGTMVMNPAMLAAASSVETPEQAPPPEIKNLPEKQAGSFQRFVFETTGKWLPYFGEKAFEKTVSSSVINAPVSADYEIGAGDELLIRIWGAIDVNHRAVVDREGQLTIPSVGTFPVAGVKARNLDSFLTAQVGKNFKNFNLSATMGKLSGVSIFVAGQALAPGMHRVNSTGTLASVIFSVAQPGTNGSFRNIQLKRGGETVATFDFYELLRKGSLTGDRKLQAGDVVFVAQSGPRVALNVEGTSAAIFELKPREGLEDILQMAGVDRTALRQDVVLIEGFNEGSPKSPRGVEQISYKRALEETKLRDGDIVTILPVRRQFSNAVTLKGNVATPARYPFFEGMRVSDLIPNTDVLIQESYYKKKGALVMFDQSSGNAGESKEAQNKKIEMVEDTMNSLISNINWEYAVVERLDRQELQPKLLTFNLRKAMEKDPANDLDLMPGDILTVFSVNDTEIPNARKTPLIKVTGEVKSPGYYQVTPGETLRDVIVKAGGLTPDAYVFGTKLIRKAIIAEQERQKQKALEQAEKMLMSAQVGAASSAIKPEDLTSVQKQAEFQRGYLDRLRAIKPDGRMVIDVAPKAKSVGEFPPLTLLDGDSITIPSTPGQVSVLGSVYSPAAFVYENNKTVFDYIGLAGGAVKSADKGSIFVMRANGTVDSAQQGWIPFVSGLYGERALPGDTVYVPEDFIRISFMKGLLDVTQVFYQLGLGAAAIKALND